MRNVCATALLCAAIAVVSACEPATPAVRELDKKNVKLVAREYDGDNGVIETPEELAKSKLFEGDASRDAIKKQVDFEKEKIVVVVWQGSSSSWVTTTVSKDGKKVSFNVVTANPALADYRPHIHAFVVPKDMSVEVPLTKLKQLLDEGMAEPPNRR